MNELDLLLKTYVELNKLHAEPGNKAHMLAYCIAYIQKKITERLKASNAK